MDAVTDFINTLDGMSLFIGLAIGLAAGLILALRNRAGMKKTFDGISEEMKQSFDSLSSEALKKSKEEQEQSNQSLLNRLEVQSKFQAEQHITELHHQKKLIDQQLEQMSSTLGKVPSDLQHSTAELAESNKGFLEFLKERADAQTKQHIAELEAKKKLIDQQLEQMSATLKEVPTELEKNQRKVSQELQKSAEQLKESNQGFLSQLSEKAETQTKEHRQELESKKELIDQRLTEMDTKLGKVQQLISEFESARESKLGALDDQLKQLTQTTSKLQEALADNRARGQWGERIAEQILQHLGLQEGFSYRKQPVISSGERPDFTFLLPNKLSLNMDCKFPIDNYLRYFEARNDTDRERHRSNFLKNVEKHVTDVTKRDYINAETVDCVLIFIPNEQIYRFIHEHGHSIIDSALKQRVILCSPLTLYIVLAVIRQAAQNFNVEQKSREIVKLVADIRFEWQKYAKEMASMERNFSTIHNRFKDLNGVRTRKLGAAFDKIEGVMENSELEAGYDRPLLVPRD